MWHRGPREELPQGMMTRKICDRVNRPWRTGLRRRALPLFVAVVLSPWVMGPEIESTELSFVNSYIFTMHGDNDNDGIYIHDQKEGQEIRISSSLVADCTDDGIDTLGSDIFVDNCIVRDMRCDKGISVFHGSATVSQEGRLLF